MTGHIYFLIYKKEIIYIGQTTNIITRIRTYLTYAYFDDIRLIECPVEKMKHYEKRLINYFKPKCNSANNPAKTPLHYQLMPKRGKRKRKKISQFKVLRPFIDRTPKPRKPKGYSFEYLHRAFIS